MVLGWFRLCSRVTLRVFTGGAGIVLGPLGAITSDRMPWGTGYIGLDI